MNNSIPLPFDGSDFMGTGIINLALEKPLNCSTYSYTLSKEYARQLLDALYLKYGNGRRSGFERFARSEQHSISQCPVCPCSYHAAHLNPY
jgi:hypothetical protein